MPPTDILGSYQNGIANPEKGPNPEVKLDPNQARVLDTFPSYCAQADSATSFYIFNGHVRSSDACVYFVRQEEVKKYLKIGILESPPGK